MGATAWGTPPPAPDACGLRPNPGMEAGPPIAPRDAADASAPTGSCPSRVRRSCGARHDLKSASSWGLIGSADTLGPTEAMAIAAAELLLADPPATAAPDPELPTVGCCLVVDHLSSTVDLTRALERRACATGSPTMTTRGCRGAGSASRGPTATTGRPFHPALSAGFARDTPTTATSQDASSSGSVASPHTGTMPRWPQLCATWRAQPACSRSTTTRRPRSTVVSSCARTLKCGA
mmetsp:Transcript_30580/g.78030  ORF Transcript_30580/g.78030 Transcript_30580/m.78030 type:complete len:236 (-) Transcript_30580:2994-3701(-)